MLESLNEVIFNQRPGQRHNSIFQRPGNGQRVNSTWQRRVNLPTSRAIYLRSLGLDFNVGSIFRITGSNFQHHRVIFRFVLNNHVILIYTYILICACSCADFRRFMATGHINTNSYCSPPRIDDSTGSTTSITDDIGSG